MKFTKEQLIGKKIRYKGEKQWQQIVDACASVGIPVAEWVGCNHVKGNTVACISYSLNSNHSYKLLSSKRWGDRPEDDEEYSNLKQLVFSFEEEEGVEDASSEEWDGEGLPPVGTECSLWTKHSGNKSKFDCKILGYHKGSSGYDWVWVEKLGYEDFEDFFAITRLTEVTFSKIKPKPWQEVLYEEVQSNPSIIHMEYHSGGGFGDLFKIDCQIESNKLVALAKRIVELSEEASQK